MRLTIRSMLEGDQDNTDGLFPEPLDTPQMQSFAPLCSVFRRFLKSHDLKYTQERADILDAIIARDGAFEAEELLLDLRARAHDVSKATVYRTLRLLLDAGIITQSLFDAKQSHYELLYGREPRDCMVCMKTGRRIEFSSKELPRTRLATHRASISDFRRQPARRGLTECDRSYSSNSGASFPSMR